jgi:sugar lactone lactonase YvrE
VSSDPANNLGPQWNQMPTVFGLDNGYNRIVWNALDPTDSSWTFHTAQFKFNNPMGIATNGNNKVIVADTYNNRLVEFTIQIGSDGIDLVNPSIIGCQGIKPGQFNHPYGVCYDGVGNIWVADTNNYRIQSLFPNGAPRSMERFMFAI